MSNVRVFKTRVFTIVGDNESGKTSLIKVLAKGRFPTESERRRQSINHDYYSKLLNIADKSYLLNLHDTSSEVDLAFLRKIHYAESDVIFICAPVYDLDKFIASSKHWMEEIRRERPEVPVVLVGTKTDLREDHRIRRQTTKLEMRFVNMEEGRIEAAGLGAIEYFECSAKTDRAGVEEMFKTSFRLTNSNRYQKNKSCILM